MALRLNFTEEALKKGTPEADARKIALKDRDSNFRDHFKCVLRKRRKRARIPSPGSQPQGGQKIKTEFVPREDKLFLICPSSKDAGSCS